MLGLQPGLQPIVNSMNKNRNNYRSHWHCVYKMMHHLVLVTKYRRKALSKEILEELNFISNELCEKWDVTLHAFCGIDTHVHLLIEMHPNFTPAKFINNLKTVTSRIIRKRHQEHFDKFFWNSGIWTRAYCLLTTGGPTINTIKKYIQNQGEKNAESLSIAT